MYICYFLSISSIDRACMLHIQCSAMTVCFLQWLETFHRPSKIRVYGDAQSIRSLGDGHQSYDPRPAEYRGATEYPAYFRSVVLNYRGPELDMTACHMYKSANTHALHLDHDYMAQTAESHFITSEKVWSQLTVYIYSQYIAVSGVSEFFKKLNRPLSQIQEIACQVTHVRLLHEMSSIIDISCQLYLHVLMTLIAHPCRTKY